MPQAKWRTIPDAIRRVHTLKTRVIFHDLLSMHNSMLWDHARVCLQCLVAVGVRSIAQNVLGFMHSTHHHNDPRNAKHATQRHKRKHTIVVRSYGACARDVCFFLFVRVCVVDRVCVVACIAPMFINDFTSSASVCRNTRTHIDGATAA